MDDVMCNRWLDMDEKVAARTKEEMRSEVRWHFKATMDSLMAYVGRHDLLMDVMVGIMNSFLEE